MLRDWVLQDTWAGCESEQGASGIMVTEAKPCRAMLSGESLGQSRPGATPPLPGPSRQQSVCGPEGDAERQCDDGGVDGPRAVDGHLREQKDTHSDAGQRHSHRHQHPR